MSASPSISRSPHLSVAIIARDAEELLSATLLSVKSIADEIVVVDTGSKDRTTQIAREHATVVTQPWDEDFSAARNFAWDHLHGDWVLWMDAGEQLSADSAQAIRQFVLNQADPTAAYVLLVRLEAIDPQAGTEQVGRIRLLPRRDDLRFAGRVREQIRPAVDQADLRVEGLPWPILRPSRDHNPQVKADKARRDLHLAQLEKRDQGPSPRLLIAAGEALANLDQKPQAREVFRQAIATSERGGIEMLEAYYGLLTACDGDGEAEQDQIAIALEALEIYPLDAQLLCAMGTYLQAQQRLDLAVRAYETAFRHGQIHPETWHLKDIHEIAAVCLALAWQLQERHDLALGVLEEALEQNEGSSRLLRQLLDLHVQANRRHQALDLVDRLPGEPAGREALRSAVRGACLGSQQNWISALAYLKTAHAAGCNDPLCLRWLAVTLLSMGDFIAAEPILRQWQTIEPLNGEAQQYLLRVDQMRAAGEAGPPLAPSASHLGGKHASAPLDQGLASGPHVRVDAPAPSAHDHLASKLPTLRQATPRAARD